MAVYEVCPLNLWARENLVIEVEAESPGDASDEVLRLHPSYEVLSVTGGFAAARRPGDGGRRRVSAPLS